MLTRITLILIAVFGLSLSDTVSQGSSLKADESPLTLTPHTINGRRYTVEDVLIVMAFKNGSKTPVRILNAFNDRNNRSFFMIVLRDEDGTPIGPFGGGSITLPRSSMKYVDLQENEEFTVRINVTEFLRNYKLKPGAYEVSVTYFNQNGEDCFKGKLESGPIRLDLEGNDACPKD